MSSVIEIEKAKIVTYPEMKAIALKVFSERDYRELINLLERVTSEWDHANVDPDDETHKASMWFKVRELTIYIDLHE